MSLDSRSIPIKSHDIKVDRVEQGHGWLKGCIGVAAKANDAHTVVREIIMIRVPVAMHHELDPSVAHDGGQTLTVDLRFSTLLVDGMGASRRNTKRTIVGEQDIGLTATATCRDLLIRDCFFLPPRLPRHSAILVDGICATAGDPLHPAEVSSRSARKPVDLLADASRHWLTFVAVVNGPQICVVFMIAVNEMHCYVVIEEPFVEAVKVLHSGQGVLPIPKIPKLDNIADSVSIRHWQHRLIPKGMVAVRITNNE